MIQRKFVLYIIYKYNPMSLYNIIHYSFISKEIDKKGQSIDYIYLEGYY